MLRYPEWQCRSVTMDKYAGRFVGEIFVPSFNLGEWLLEQGLARPYDGGRKPKWGVDELEAIALKCDELGIRF